MSALATGQLIADRYRLDRRIAVGGMGEVWEAQDTRLGRSVAVKVLRPELSDDPEFLHRFRIEARTVASLDHARHRRACTTTARTTAPPAAGAPPTW